MSAAEADGQPLVVLDEVVDGGVWARVRDGLSGLLQ